MKNLTEREEKERVMQFLMGLNDTYSTVQGSILMMNPLSDTRKVHGLVLQHESQVEVTSRNDSLITPHAMQISCSSVPGSSQPCKSLKCTNCDGDGHTKERCYFITGFPVGHKWHGKNVKPRNQRYSLTVHNVEIHPLPAKPTDTTKTTTADGPTFTTEEYNELIAMLRNKKGNGKPLAHATDISLPTSPISHPAQADPPFTTFPSADPAQANPAQLPSLTPLSGPSFPSTSSLSMLPLSPIDGGFSPPLTFLGPPSTSLDPSILSTSLTPPLSSTFLDLPVHLTPTDPPPLPRRPERVKRPHSHFSDYQAHHMALLTPKVVSSSMSGTRYALHQYVSYSGLSPAYWNFVCNISQLVEPSSYAQACQDPKWVATMHSELQALEANHTWSLVSLPPGLRPIGCKWIFGIKYNSDGTVDRFKARLVAKGFNQREGIDFTDTFAPVAKLINVLCLLSIAAAHHWPLHQMDVHNAFLHGDLQEEVYMLPPPGSCRQGEHVVCRLHKSLYGLKQAPRNWFRKFSYAICGIGFKQSRADYSLFTHVQGSSLTIILLYVDDMIITGKLLKDPTRYRRLVGKLIYLTITKQEITYAVNTLSQFMQEPKRQHLEAAYRLLHYLKEAPGQGLLFPAENKLKLIGYCDADWARCQSHTDQSLDIASSLDLHVAHSEPAKLFCDNQAALYTAANPVYHE
ncbi:hypothetical protein L3X38_015031 [Prunus dulcis]|uniref:Reverse transcriptase Ty1/copia-type domain-containing protein n=1 Tax=Prunus dulcis TaxID=3755 RepID=A0AAD4ZHN1_PRUDU|nr:hypothetical protein L3X38_015031 [Prunus dulcis]